MQHHLRQRHRLPALAWLACLACLAWLACLVGQQAEAGFPFQSLFGSSSAGSPIPSGPASSSLSRLRASRIRRPDSCRESLPRKSDDLPALVITAKVREVYLAAEQPAAAGPPISSGSAAAGGANDNKALVTVGRVIKGNQQLAGADLIISGFNSTSSQPCPNYVKPNDTLILLLNQEGERKYSIQGSNLLSMNLNNLERVNAIAADEPPRRRGPIEDILCEARYCPYGRCVVSELTNQTSCACPDSCPDLPMPVCGSDNATYVNECHLIKEGCQRQRPLFVTKEASC